MPDIPSKASFEDLSSMIEMITGKKLVDVIKANQVTDCTSLCDCHSRYCACHGSVSSRGTYGQEVINPVDYAELRTMRIAELKKQLEVLSKGGE